MPDDIKPEALPEIKQEQPPAAGEPAPGFVVVCWDDPVNRMEYVTHVFQVVFGWEREQAEWHLMDVQQQGRTVLAHTNLEEALAFVQKLQKYTLHVTLEPDYR
jgi:ATP-dependent Clp protease adaptor protein ClpS